MLDLIALLLWLFMGGTVTGEATYYHPSLNGEVMRNGEAYNQEDMETVAVGISLSGFPIVPLSTRLLICTKVKCIKATVKDTGVFPQANLDLSRAAFSSLDILEKGRLQIQWRIVPKTT